MTRSVGCTTLKQRFGSPGLVVMGRYSHARGLEIEPQEQVLLESKIARLITLIDLIFLPKICFQIRWLLFSKYAHTSLKPVTHCERLILQNMFFKAALWRDPKTRFLDLFDLLHDFKIINYIRYHFLTWHGFLDHAKTLPSKLRTNL